VVYQNALSCLHDFSKGFVFMVGGFGLCGVPENLISAIHFK